MAQSEEEVKQRGDWGKFSIPSRHQMWRGGGESCWDIYGSLSLTFIVLQTGEASIKMKIFQYFNKGVQGWMINGLLQLNVYKSIGDIAHDLQQYSYLSLKS